MILLSLLNTKVEMVVYMNTLTAYLDEFVVQ